MNLRITASHSPAGRIQLPASKSISNRMLLLSELAERKIKLHNISDCDDTFVMLRALKRGSIIDNQSRTRDTRVQGALNERPEVMDIMAAGTAMRFLTAYYATHEGTDIVITGTERMRHRPIRLLVDALRSLGANISYEGEEGYPPLRIEGRRLEGGDIWLPGNVSSQYISALLMVAPTMVKGLTLHIEGETISRPYINITLSLMRRFGIVIDEPDEQTYIVHAGEYSGGDYLIENDWSAASYWYEALALADEGEVVLEGLFADSLQGDSCVRRLFAPLGVATEFRGNDAVLRKTAKSIDRYVADLTECPDLAQTMVATCCGMGVPFRFSGLQSLRIKETDRLLALRQELAKLGYGIEEHEGSVLEWRGEHDAIREPLPMATYDDHRMAMCLAPLACRCERIIINDAQVVSKSYPTFWQDLRSVGYGAEEL